MDKPIRYGKPVLTNMPYEIGKPIFDKILSTPRPDFEKMKAEAEEIEREWRRIRMEEDAREARERSAE